MVGPTEDSSRPLPRSHNKEVTTWVGNTIPRTTWYEDLIFMETYSRPRSTGVPESDKIVDR